jgi:hypothetical protein
VSLADVWQLATAVLYRKKKMTGLFCLGRLSCRSFGAKQITCHTVEVKTTCCLVRDRMTCHLEE